MTSPGEFYASLPPISKTWGTTLLATSAFTSLKLLKPVWLILSLPLVFSKFQVWRLLTCFLWIGNFGLPLVFGLLMIIQCAVKLEKDAYEGRPADFLFVLIFGMGCMLPCTLIPFFDMPILSKSLITFIVYVWSRQYPNQNVSIMGLVSLPAFYFPWLLLAMSVLMGGDVFPDLLGCLVGHLHYFLGVVYPQTSGHTLLATPAWVHWLVYTWAQHAPDMFPASARLHPQAQANTQRIYLRPSAPAAQGGPSHPSVAGGGASRQMPTPMQVPPQQGSQAFRGRSYRLDRD